MLKMMNKKLLGKKGFTLAELLVVIAILAILIAIAVPVFTHMVAESNLRVNQANVHSVRSAAVAHILTHLGEEDAAGAKLNAYMGNPDHFWVAIAKVDNNGNISDLQVLAFEKDTKLGVHEGISTKKPPTGGFSPNYFNGSETDTFFPINDVARSKFASVKPSMGTDKSDDGASVYYVQAVVTDLTKDK